MSSTEPTIGRADYAERIEAKRDRLETAACRCAGSPPPLADWADVVADALHHAVAVIVLSWAVTAAAVYGWMAFNG